MRTAARAPFHALRSAMVALTVVSLAAGAHTLAGGGLALARSRSNKPVPVRAPAPGSAPKQ